MIKSNKGFRSFYQNENNAEQYDNIRLNTFKKRVVRCIESNFFIHRLQKNHPKILELGCGTGYITQHLAKYGQVTAIDLSDEMMSFAKQRSYKNPVKFHKMNIFDVDQINESFDYIVSSRVILHLDEHDLLKSLKKISQVLNKGGVCLFDIQRSNFIRKLLNSFQPNKVYNFPYNKLKIKEILAQVPTLSIDGFCPLDHSGILLPVYLLFNTLPIKIAEKFIFKTEVKLLRNVYYGFDRWGIILKRV